MLDVRCFLAPLVAAFLCACSVAFAAQSSTDSRPEAILRPRGVYEGHTARPLRYYPDGTDFVITNGAEFFNRPLYFMNTASRVDGGDKPEFSLYLPGRGGNLRFGIRTAEGVKWLNDAQTIITRYRPGSLIYTVGDPALGGATLALDAVPLSAERGFVVRAELSGESGSAELVWAYGGANGMRGSRDGDIGCEREPISRFFQLRPDQCANSTFSIETNGFTLRTQTAEIAGEASSPPILAEADATKWNDLEALLASAGHGTELPVLVGRSELRAAQPLYLALFVQRVRRENVAEEPLPAPSELKALFAAAEQHRTAIANRVVVDTPDPFINAAAAAINVAGDAIWDEAQGAYMHGAVAWRRRLLGWRGPYTGDALGWHDRARRHFTYWAGRQNTKPVPDKIPPADPTVNLARNEPALHSNGDMSGTHYDMNLVYIDALFRHFLWTGDIHFARQVWPVIERHLAWERRLFRRTFGPDHLPLYEAYAAIWASDDMQFNGGAVAYTSAYNYFHNRMAARIAKLLGEDPAPFEREAELIAKAMREYLWLPHRGWFAEWKDYLGLQRVHPNAGLWTFYHTIDSEVPTPFEAWEMTRFVDTQIAHIPIHGPGVPAGGYFTLATTSWMPYVWSVNNVVMAESAHTSLAYWQAGRPESAFRLFKGCLLDSMFLGLCPGNLGMTTYFDMARGEAQRDFADAVGVCSRTMVEGLFGIHPDVLAGELVVRPGFPSDWNHASMRHPDFSFDFKRDGLTETYLVEPAFPKPMKVRLIIPALRVGVAEVTVNGRPSKWQALEDSVGTPRLEIESEPGRRIEIVVRWQGAKPATAAGPAVVAKGAKLDAAFGSATALTITDPEQALSGTTADARGIRGTATGSLGDRTVFAKLRQGDFTWWQPVGFDLRRPREILASERQDADHLRFRVRNNTTQPIDHEVTVRTGGQSEKLHLQVPAFGESDEIVMPAKGLSPGSIELEISGLPEVPTEAHAGLSNAGRASTVLQGIVTNWKLQSPAGSTFEPVDLASVFNDKVTQIFRNEYLSPRSPFCSLELPKQGIGGWCDYATTFDVDDSGLRGEALKHNGEFRLPDGVPFRTPGANDAKNIAFTSQWDNYPSGVTVPLNGRAAHVYLLMAGSSNPMQSRFDNGEVVVTYADGSTNRLALRNPTTWWPIDQNYFIDDYAFRRPEPIPPRVDLKTGQVRILDLASFKGRGGKVPGGAATVLDLPLDRERQLKSLTVHTTANDVVIGLMGATLVR